jgi:2-methylisocitrate lyase-like PEP mutase family enzyme
MTDHSALAARAETLRRLHDERRPLVLPTVWDAWSARVAVDCGFEALTIGSHPLAESRGSTDQEGQSLPEVVEAVARIVAAVDVPVSVDLESGYGVDPDELIAALLQSGGVGLNVEDTVHSDGGRVRSTEEHAGYIAGLRAAADAAGVPVWINGRTDLFAHAEDKHAVRDEVLERLRALVASGADSVYPVKIQDDDALLRAMVEGVDVPVNATAHPAKHTLERFAGLGIRRITHGPLLQAALTDSTKELLAGWRAPG